mgnify:CR=1 FL=1
MGQLLLSYYRESFMKQLLVSLGVSVLLYSLFHIWDLLQFTDKRIGKKVNEAAPSLFRCAAFFRVAFIILAHFSSFSTADSY